MNEFEMVIEMLDVVKAYYEKDDRYVKIVVYGDHSGHFAHDEGKGEKILFSFGKDFGNMFKSFARWLVERRR